MVEIRMTIPDDVLEFHAVSGRRSEVVVCDMRALPPSDEDKKSTEEEEGIGGQEKKETKKEESPASGQGAGKSGQKAEVKAAQEQQQPKGEEKQSEEKIVLLPPSDSMGKNSTEQGADKEQERKRESEKESSSRRVQSFPQRRSLRLLSPSHRYVATLFFFNVGMRDLDDPLYLRFGGEKNESSNASMEEEVAEAMELVMIVSPEEREGEKAREEAARNKNAKGKNQHDKDGDVDKGNERSNETEKEKRSTQHQYQQKDEQQAGKVGKERRRKATSVKNEATQQPQQSQSTQEEEDEASVSVSAHQKEALAVLDSVGMLNCITMSVLKPYRPFCWEKYLLPLLRDGTISSLVLISNEDVGKYFLCASFLRSPSPPIHACIRFNGRTRADVDDVTDPVCAPLSGSGEHKRRCGWFHYPSSP